MQLQGYEPQVLLKLLETRRYVESDFDFDQFPEIWYPDPMTQRRRRYHPDLWIPSENRIIEVKSEWTLLGTEVWHRDNKAKRDQCVREGYAFEFLVWSKISKDFISLTNI